MSAYIGKNYSKNLAPKDKLTQIKKRELLEKNRGRGRSS
jgi:hypothetical protein